MLQEKPIYIGKSKRQKLKQKKARKFARKVQRMSKEVKEVEPIQINSSDDEPTKINKKQQKRVVNLESQSNASKSQRQEQIVIQEKPQNKQKSAKPNQFNYARLFRLAPSLEKQVEQIKIEKLLDVVQDEGAINGSQSDAAKAYTFYVEGSKQQKSIRKIMLKDRANQTVLAQARKELLKKAQESKQVVQLTKDQDEESDDHVSEKKNRYFAVSHEKCYRCGKEGHYAITCLQEWVRKCKNCFSKQHDERSCPQICFQCGNECPYRHEKRCDRCSKKGHSSDSCGMIIDDKIQWRKLQQISSKSDLKSLKCIVESQHGEQKEKGYHFNCFEYKMVSFPYQELRVKTRPQDSVDLKDYQLDGNRRGNRYDNRRHQSRQSSYGTHYGSRVVDHYRSRFYDITGAEVKGRGQNRSFEEQRHKSHNRHHGNHGNHWRKSNFH